MSNTHEALHKSAMAIYSRLEDAQKEIKELRADLEVQHALIVQMAEALDRIEKAGVNDSRLELDQTTWQAIQAADTAIAAATQYLKGPKT